MARIYLSSTFADLVQVRAAALSTLRRAGHEPVAMEDYASADQRPLDKCLADVAACDIYVGIVAWRFGHVPPGQPRSITELEFREALRLGKPTLLFLLHEDAPWPRSMSDRDGEAIERLRSEMTQDRLVTFFRSAEDAAALITAAVAKLDHKAPAFERGAQRTDFLRTPHLGLEVWQSGARRPLLRDRGGAIRVPLDLEAFELRIPAVGPSDHVKITGWYDESIFSYIEKDTPYEHIPYFSLGTGMADTDFGSGELWLSNEAHMYLDWGGRLISREPGGGLVLFHSIGDPGRGEGLPQGRKVHLVVHVAKPTSSTAGPYDCERLILSF